MGNLIYGLLALLLTAPAAEARVGFHLGGHAGMGQLGGHSSARPEFPAGHFDLQFMPGWRFANAGGAGSGGGATAGLAGAGGSGGMSNGLRLMAGVLLEYRFVSQLEESRPLHPDQSGTSFLWGLGGTLESGRLKLLASWDPAARHWLKSPRATLKGSGLHLLAGWQFEPGWFVDLQFFTTSYDTYAPEGGGDEDLLGPDQARHWSVALGASYSY